MVARYGLRDILAKLGMATGRVFGEAIHPVIRLVIWNHARYLPRYPGKTDGRVMGSPGNKLPASYTRKWYVFIKKKCIKHRLLTIEQNIIFTHKINTFSNQTKPEFLPINQHISQSICSQINTFYKTDNHILQMTINKSHKRTIEQSHLPHFTSERVRPVRREAGGRGGRRLGRGSRTGLRREYWGGRDDVVWWRHRRQGSLRRSGHQRWLRGKGRALSRDCEREWVEVLRSGCGWISVIECCFSLLVYTLIKP